MTDEFRNWLAHRAGANYDDTNPFERGLRAAYQDAFVRMVDEDAADASRENGE